MGNVPKIQKLGINPGTQLGNTEFIKLWENYMDGKETMSYNASHKFLKEFAQMAGVTYVERLAEVIIFICDKEKNGMLTKEQFEWLVFYSAQATDMKFTDTWLKRDDEVKRIFKQNLKLLNDTQKEEGRYCLCFPSISTHAYQFDVTRAAKVATKVIKEFLTRYDSPQIKLYLVDIKESETLKKFREYKALEEINDPRYSILPANITLLRDYGIQSWYLVNASNPSFHGRGSGTNRAIHTAASAGDFSLEKETRKLYSKNAKTAKAYPVDLRDGSPLKDFQGVKTVIHVVGPNMSPKRPRYLADNYEIGEKLLKRTYESIFRSFMKQTGLDVEIDNSSSASEEDIKIRKKKPKREKVVDASDDQSSGDETSHEESHNRKRNIENPTQDDN
jgi:O-acetyl-ADP-ribose deacetylase (regulator of RNase III)